MAWINKNEVKNIKELLKKEFPTYKFSVTGSNSSELSIRLLVSDLDFNNDAIIKYQNSNCYGVSEKENEDYRISQIEKGNFNLNHYHLESNWKGKSLEVFNKVIQIAKSQNWFDKSDSQSDYFFVAYYFSIGVGSWTKTKGLINHKKIETSTVKEEVNNINENTEYKELLENGTIEEFTHTKTQELLKVLKLSVKLSKEQFKEFNIWLSSEGIGYYSKFARGFILKKDLVRA
jgi:hypothetical protein